MKLNRGLSAVFKGSSLISWPKILTFVTSQCSQLLLSQTLISWTASFGLTGISCLAKFSRLKQFVLRFKILINHTHFSDPSAFELTRVDCIWRWEALQKIRTFTWYLWSYLVGHNFLMEKDEISVIRAHFNHQQSNRFMQLSCNPSECGCPEILPMVLSIAVLLKEW